MQGSLVAGLVAVRRSLLLCRVALVFHLRYFFIQIFLSEYM